MEAEWEMMALCNDAVCIRVRGFVSDCTLRICVRVFKQDSILKL